VRLLQKWQCPDPYFCGGTSWHLTPSSQERCRHQQAATLAASLEPAETYEQTLEREEENRAARARAAAIAAHRHILPTLAADIDVARHGERQLRNLHADHLRTLGLLIYDDIYRTNLLLRRGASLEAAASKMLDYNGYATLRQFVDDVDQMFGALGNAIQLGGTMQAFRGVDVTGTPTDFSPDVAGIGARLENQTPLQSSFVDRGIGFATTSAAIALRYPEPGHTLPDRQRVLVQLEVHSALCLPRVEHMTPSLFEHVAGTTDLHTQVPHLVFPLGTAWEITSIDPQSAHGLPLVYMRQK
jgi:hypothetical protein